MEEAPLAARTYHVPIMVREVVELLRPAVGGIFVDGTLGGGGHSEALLQAGARVIGVDQDPDAMAYASARLAPYGDRFAAVQGNFSAVEAELDALGATQVQGALLDCGVSSHQLDEATRGFSFQTEGPLSMRMDQGAEETAGELVNTASAEELAQVFRTLGEEPAAWRIAQHLVKNRPFATTLELARAVEAVSPRRGRTHPATRVFQALRMAVNRELEVLELGLRQLAQRLAPGGRLAVLTFHSLEDRLVKQFFATHSAPEVDHPTWPAPRPNPVRLFQKITGKALVASAAEQAANPRARSAKLRVVERLSLSKPNQTAALRF